MNIRNNVNVIHSIHFYARFSSGEGRGDSSPRRTWNTSRSTAISDGSAGSTPRRDQARSEMHSLHLGLGWSLNRFSVGLASWTCLANLSYMAETDILISVLSQFRGDVIPRSRLCEFHSCALCREVSHHGLIAKSFSATCT